MLEICIFLYDSVEAVQKFTVSFHMVDSKQPWERDRYMEVWKEMYGGHVEHLACVKFWNFLMIDVFEVLRDKFKVISICIIGKFAQNSITKLCNYCINL